MKKVLFISIAAITLIGCTKPDPVPPPKPPVYEGIQIGGCMWAQSNVNAPEWLSTPDYNGTLYRWNDKTAWLYFNLAGETLKSSVPAGLPWDYDFTPTGDHWELYNDPCPTGWHLPTLQNYQDLFASDYRWVDAGKELLRYDTTFVDNKTTMKIDTVLIPVYVWNYSQSGIWIGLNASDLELANRDKHESSIFFSGTIYRNENSNIIGVQNEIMLWTLDGWIVKISKSTGFSWYQDKTCALPIRCVK